jgi:hypothetical protein
MKRKCEEQAVHEELSIEEPKREFFRISDENRAAMARKRLSEEDILAEFTSACEKLNQ